MKAKRSFLRSALAAILMLVLLFTFAACGAKSNYDLALQNGYTGTLSEWLETLKGKSAYDIAVEQGFEGSQEQWIASLSTVDIEELYELYKAQYPLKTIDDFLEKFLAENLDKIVINEYEDTTEAAVQLALRSGVSIRAGFSYSTAPREKTGAGSGVIFDLSHSTGVAYIITNYHVIYDYKATNKISQKIEIAPYGKEYFSSTAGLTLSIKAEFVGGSVSKDIAVLKTEPNETLKSTVYRAAAIADSNATAVGEPIIAVGNPQGAGLSATRGIVSVDSEYIEMAKLDTAYNVSEQHRVIRVDAAINGGNSGGGLYNRNGKLIGIVNAKAVDTLEDDETISSIDNIGYAIPSNVASGIARIVFEGQKTAGNFISCKIGVTTTIAGSKAVLDKDGFVRIQEEIKITEISSGGLGSKSDLQTGDILLKAQLLDKDGNERKEGIDITRGFMLADYLYAARDGDKLDLTVLRNGAEKTVRITVSLTSAQYYNVI